MSLFDLLEDQNRERPLADKIRPKSLESLVGHSNIIGKGKALRILIDSEKLSSMILWGPPGCGKTTIARIIAEISKSHFKELSAVNSSVKDLREAVSEAKTNLRNSSTPTILFIDEIHRYSKTQQDAILPYVEDGTVTFIGATTENPSFEVIPALRSRVQIVKLGRLSKEDLKEILNSTLENKEKGLGNYNLFLEEGCLDYMVEVSSGDARFALNFLEMVSKVAKLKNKKRIITMELLKQIMENSSVIYDKASDEHYDHLSAYQKSLRGSDADAAIYWLAKMIAGGEDPKVIGRRLLITASEDVSNADPLAFLMASEAYESVLKIGLPEARIPLAQATIYVARAIKSNSSIVAIDNALADVRNGKGYPVPIHLKDSHYKDAKKYGHGVDYVYSHSKPDYKQEFLPEQLKDVKYLKPANAKEAKRLNMEYEP